MPRLKGTRSRKDGAEAWRRAAILGGLLACIALVIHGVFGADGLMTLLAKRRKARELSQQIEQLKQENQNLQKDVQGLKSDPATIERYAREELHMSRQGEIIYMLPGKAQDPQNAKVTKPSAKP